MAPADVSIALRRRTPWEACDLGLVMLQRWWRPVYGAHLAVAGALAALLLAVVWLLDGSPVRDRKSTRLNSSHTVISYAVFCLKKKSPICPHSSAIARSFACSSTNRTPAFTKKEIRPKTVGKSAPDTCPRERTSSSTAIALVTWLGSEMEGHRKTALPLVEVATVEIVRAPGVRVPLICAHDPRLVALGQPVIAHFFF